MARIVWSDKANQWMQEIFDHIAQDNPIAAGQVIDGIFEKAQILAEFPEIGYIYQTDSGDYFRILLYEHYRIAYFYHPESGWVEVLGVYHGAMDIDRHLP